MAAYGTGGRLKSRSRWFYAAARDTRFANRTRSDREHFRRSVPSMLRRRTGCPPGRIQGADTSQRHERPDRSGRDRAHTPRWRGNLDRRELRWCRCENPCERPPLRPAEHRGRGLQHGRTVRFRGTPGLGSAWSDDVDHAVRIQMAQPVAGTGHSFRCPRRRAHGATAVEVTAQILRR